MNIKSAIYTIFLTGLLLPLFLNCKKEEKAGVLAFLATLTTTPASNITTSGATLGGNVTSDNYATVTERGVVFSTSAIPTINNSTCTKVSNGTGTGSFTSNVTGLTAGTVYYVRAYAINSRGIAYGDQQTFTTSLTLSVASVTTTAASNITTTSATLGGNVTSDGNTTVTERGVVYATTQTPTTASTKVSNGTGTGSFTSNITGLTVGTVYYVRAYAINSQGTAYGDQQTFTTSLTLSVATVTTTAASNITTTGATLGGNVTSDGNATVTERGVVYATTQTPTTANTKVSNGTGTGSFTSNITGLTAGTVYYVRAYAVNSQGTAYGSQQTFTTSLTLSVATITTTTASNITTTGATLGGNVTSDGNTTVTERGVVYATSQTPTTANTKVSNGTGTGSFTSNVTGLTSGTIYYVRAYAVNSQGTAYGSQQTFTTTSGGGSGTVTDIDGNVYTTVTIGTQVWMVENLKTTKYRNGDQIANETGAVNWRGLITGAYCWYNNDVNYKTIYGGLYNWYAVNDSRNIAPTGWHVPTLDEWGTLSNYLGGAGGKLKEIGISHWISPNTAATNESGFTALPGGNRNDYGGFQYIGDIGTWWTSKGDITSTAWDVYLYSDLADFTAHLGSMTEGKSVRCVKD